MSFVLQLLGALIILGVLIFVHELGHFAMAKALGFRVDEFSMGFGPKVFARARKDTVYSLRALPLGGFCRFHMEEEGGTEENGDYAAQKPWKRFLVTLAGPFTNILLAWGDTACVISAVNAGSPAQQAGLLPGDMIVAVAGEDLAFDFAALENVQQADPSEGVELTVVRNGERLIVTVSGLTADAETGRLMMGVTLDYSARRSFGFGEALTSAFDYLSHPHAGRVPVFHFLRAQSIRAAQRPGGNGGRHHAGGQLRVAVHLPAVYLYVHQLRRAQPHSFPGAGRRTAGVHPHRNDL